MGISNSAFINTTNQISAAVQTALSTYTKVGETTLGANAAIITVSGIPNTYKKLFVYVIGTKDAAVAAVYWNHGGAEFWTGERGNTTTAAAGAVFSGYNYVQAIPSVAANAQFQMKLEISLIQGTRVGFIGQGGTNVSQTTLVGDIGVTTLTQISCASLSSGDLVAGTRLEVYGIM